MMQPLLLSIALAAVPAAAADCPPIAGLEPLLQPGRVLLLGEIHGTGESPAFVADVACHAASRKLPVVVGLELSSVEQKRVDRFLDSAGTPEDREQLVAGPTWQRGYQDGRNSHAMVELIDALRLLRAAGAAVDVSLFDASGAGGGQARDRAMGHNLARVAQRATKALTVALAGNLHSRTTKGRARNVDYEPLGYVLAKSIDAERVVALDVAHGGGAAWICSQECGVVEFGEKGDAKSWVIEIGDATRTPGHHGRYHVGRLSASRPARLERSEPLQLSSVEGA
ncbi:MAG: hypothetical protein GY716_01870, partial [bacterium]|nr:hypothetical protein [bacterium]